MPVTVREVKSRNDYREFVYLPAVIHRGHQQWIPPVWMDEKKFFNPAKNKSFSRCDTIMLLAFREKQVLGRIMGIINHEYNDHKKEKNARFGFMECYDDEQVSHILLRAVEDWARSKGMHRIVGPYGFSDKDPQGFLIEGFEHRAVIAANCNYPYLVQLVEQEGYTREVDCFAFRLPVNMDIPEAHRRIHERVSRNGQFGVAEFTKRSQLKPWIMPILELMNECYQDIYGFVPLTKEEMKDFAGRYLPVIDPRFVKLVVKKNELLSFVIALPNFSAGLQRSRGYLFPFGIFHILRSMKKSRQLDLMLGGVKPSSQGLGLELLMGFSLLDSVRAAGFEQIEVHLILETNYKMLAEVQKLNAISHKRFRVFGKNL